MKSPLISFLQKTVRILSNLYKLNNVNLKLTFRFESAFKFESTEGFVDESKPPFEDDDIDFAGSDIELQLEEIVDKANESESAAAQSSAYKGNSEIASRHKSLPCGSQKPSKMVPFVSLPNL